MAVFALQLFADAFGFGADTALRNRHAHSEDGAVPSDDCARSSYAEYCIVHFAGMSSEARARTSATREIHYHPQQLRTRPSRRQARADHRRRHGPRQGDRRPLPRTRRRSRHLRPPSRRARGDGAGIRAALRSRPSASQQCDIRSADSVEAMMDRIWADGPLDSLVNNAAGNFLAQSEKLSSRAIDAVLNTCLHGTAYCTVAAGRAGSTPDDRASSSPFSRCRRCTARPSPCPTPWPRPASTR